MTITAAILAEVCSALPLSGSIYIWAAESAGPKFARFFGFIVAWWSTTAWMTFVAGNCQVSDRSSSIFCISMVTFLDHGELLGFSPGYMGSKFSWRN
jgi:amino acid transporter